MGAVMLSGILHEQGGNFQAAQKAYEAVLELNPGFVPAANNLAYIYSEYLNNAERAFILAKAAREKAPEDANVADTLGWIIYKMGNYQWALTYLQESAAKMPDSAEVQFHLGMANYQLGNSEEAKRALTRALSIDPGLKGAEDARKALAEIQ